MKKVINVKTQEQYNELMKRLEAEWYTWGNWNKPSKINYFDTYKEDTCVNIESEVDIQYSDKQYYIDNWYEIISFEEYMLETKEEIKPWDLVWVTNYNQKYADEDFRDGANHYYIWRNKKWKYVVEEEDWYIDTWKYISNKAPKEELIEIKTTYWQTISISKEKAKELGFNI